jgi:CheY-like chemotaxis protein
MPGMSGIDLIRAIKERAPETVVVLITGYGSLDTAIQAIRAGAYDYLTKPFQLDELYVLVHNAVERIQLIKENRRLLREMERCYRDAKTGGEEGTAPEDGSSVTDECCFPAAPLERLQALERHLVGIYTRQPAGVPEKAVGRVSGYRVEGGEDHGG